MTIPPRRILFLLFSTLLVLGACEKAPELALSSAPEVSLAADGSSESITFTANRDWTASAADTWVHVSPASGAASKDPVTVTVRCDANTTYEDRQSTVTIRAEGLSQTVTVKQPANQGIIVPNQSIVLAAGDKSFEVEVQANVQYDVAISADWIKQKGTKGLTTNKLSFIVEENNTYDERSATITIKQQGGSISQTISVKQAAKSGVEIEKTAYEISADGGTLEIAVRTNVELEIAPEESWIHYSQTKALDDKTVVLTVDKNETYDERVGKVAICQKEGTLEVSLTITQEAAIPKGAVDMGLSVYWGACNIGAASEEVFGGYYAWGEIETKTEYSKATYKWMANGEYTKYNSAAGSHVIDNKTTLDLEDDVAHVQLGGAWRMPTREEMNELVRECTWTWTENNGVSGYVVKSKTNGNTIFLPQAHFYSDSGYSNDSFGRYWTSELASNNTGYCLDFSQGMVSVMDLDQNAYVFNYRWYGYSIRPVCSK